MVADWGLLFLVFYIDTLLPMACDTGLCFWLRGCVRCLFGLRISLKFGLLFSAVV